MQDLPSAAALYDAFLSRGGGAEIVQFALRSNAGPRWLDAGCGTGRLLAPFADAGVDVEGIEPRPDYATRARQRAPRVRVDTRDLASLGRGDLGPYDGVLVCNGPLSYILDDAGLDEALLGIATVLRPGGVLVSDTPDFDWILANYRDPQVQRAVVDGLSIERRPHHRIERGARRFTHIDTHVALGAEGQEVGRHTEAYVFATRSADEVIGAHVRAGFTRVRRWQSWRARAPSARATGPRILLTAWLPPARQERGGAPEAP